MADEEIVATALLLNPVDNFSYIPQEWLTLERCVPVLMLVPRAIYSIAHPMRATILASTPSLLAIAQAQPAAYLRCTVYPWHDSELTATLETFYLQYNYRTLWADLWMVASETWLTVVQRVGMRTLTCTTRSQVSLGRFGCLS